jgi:hypothetical protein
VEAVDAAQLDQVLEIPADDGIGAGHRGKRQAPPVGDSRGDPRLRRSTATGACGTLRW